MVVALGTIAILGYLFYLLFIKGIAWPIIGTIFIIYGGSILIRQLIPSSSATIMTFLSYEISVATFISGIISVLAIGYWMTKEET